MWPFKKHKCTCKASKILKTLYDEMEVGYSSTLDFYKLDWRDNPTYTQKIHVNLDGKRVRKAFESAFNYLYGEQK